MEILPGEPRVRKERPEAFELKVAGTVHLPADGVLHPCVRGDDEDAGKPRSEAEHPGAQGVDPPRDPPCAVEENAEEYRFEEERQDAFHREGLADDGPGEPRERRPARPELEFERDARDDAHHEVEPENPCPEPRSPSVMRVRVPRLQRLQDDDVEREAHGELREEIVVHRREREREPMDRKRRVHVPPTMKGRASDSWPTPATQSS